MPTVREINMLESSGWVVDGRLEIYLAKLVAKLGGILAFSGKAVHDSFRLTFKLCNKYIYLIYVNGRSLQCFSLYV